jgi:hypothetical protein
MCVILYSFRCQLLSMMMFSKAVPVKLIVLGTREVNDLIWLQSCEIFPRLIAFWLVYFLYKRDPAEHTFLANLKIVYKAQTPWHLWKKPWHDCRIFSSSSSTLARQPYVGPGLPQKLLPAEVSSYCFFRFRDKSLFQGGIVSPTPNLRLSWRADVFCQGCLPQPTSPNFKASGSCFLPVHDLAVQTLPRS